MGDADLARLGGLAQQGLAVDEERQDLVRDEVQEQGADHDVDAAREAQGRRDPGPERASDGGADDGEDQDQSSGPRNVESDCGPDGCAHEELALGPDVDDAGARRDDHTEGDDEDRRCLVDRLPERGAVLEAPVVHLRDDLSRRRVGERDQQRRDAERDRERGDVEHDVDPEAGGARSEQTAQRTGDIGCPEPPLRRRHAAWPPIIKPSRSRSVSSRVISPRMCPR